MILALRVMACHSGLQNASTPGAIRKAPRFVLLTQICFMESLFLGFVSPFH